MSPENKQRVIGIVILVAFVALLIPFLFTSGIGRKITKSDQIPITQEQRQLATQQIESAGNAVSIPTEQPKTPTATDQALVVPGSQAPVTAGQNPSETAALPPNQVPVAAGQNPVETAVLSPNQAPVAPTERSADVSFPPELSSSDNQAPMPPLPTLQSDAELTGKTHEAIIPEATTTEEQPKPQKKIDEALLMDKMVKKSTSIKAQNKAKTAPIEKLIKNKKNNIITKKVNVKNSSVAKAGIKKTGNWSVQVGSFSSPASVNKLVSHLRDKGFKAYLQKITKNNVTMTRVLVGSEADKLAAKQIADKLSADLNITGHLIRS